MVQYKNLIFIELDEHNATSYMFFSLPPMVSYECLGTNSTTENHKESVVFTHTINLNQLNDTLASELDLQNVPHTRTLPISMLISSLCPHATPEQQHGTFKQPISPNTLDWTQSSV